MQGNQPDPSYHHLFDAAAEGIDRFRLPGPDARLYSRLGNSQDRRLLRLAQGVGFVTDFFGEVLVRLREDNFQDRVRSVAMHEGLTRRDQVSVERLSSGLIKLLYPDGQMTDAELHEIVVLASELRQRVHHQLTIIAAGEFKPKLIAPLDVTEHQASDLNREIPETTDDPLNREAVVGAATGLSVLMQGDKEVGGDLILIQVSALAGSEKVQVTGRHGGDLKDSVLTAYNIVRAKFREFNIPEKRLREQMMAVHLVRISEPKDGPSAGVAFVAGMVSALTGRPIRPATAMTGEVTLHGEVLSVGGIPRKLEAAARRGRKIVIIPAANEKDLAKVSADVKAKLEIIMVKTIQEALEKVLAPA